MTRTTLIGAAILAAAIPASAQIYIFTADLDGLQEVPPVQTPGYGTATVTLDASSGHVMVSGSYFNLLAPVVAGGGGAHVHGLAPPGVNAGVIVPLVHTGGTTGTFEGMGNLTPAQVQGMIEGLTYINIHSTMFPGGEIRGQIIPAPGAMALLGCAGMLASRRRRQER